MCFQCESIKYFLFSFLEPQGPPLASESRCG